MLRLLRRFAPHNDTKGRVWRNSAVLILDCHAWLQTRNDGGGFGSPNDTMGILYYIVWQKTEILYIALNNW